MEPQAKDPEESQTPPKKVLVCFGERRREVTFSSGGGKEGDISSLLDAVAKVFADVLPAEDPTHQLILQKKNEDWDGEFIDAVGEIPDKSVVRAVRMGGSSEGLGCETRVQGEVSYLLWLCVLAEWEVNCVLKSTFILYA